MSNERVYRIIILLPCVIKAKEQQQQQFSVNQIGDMGKEDKENFFILLGHGTAGAIAFIGPFPCPYLPVSEKKIPICVGIRNTKSRKKVFGPLEIFGKVQFLRRKKNIFSRCFFNIYKKKKHFSILFWLLGLLGCYLQQLQYNL